MNTYLIPTEGRTRADYTWFCLSLPWVCAEQTLTVYPDHDNGRCGANATISGYSVCAPSLATDISVMTAKIKAERDRRKLNGVFVSGKWIHTDVYSRTQWIGMSMMGASIPSIEWSTMDGTPITTTQALAGAVFIGVATLDATLYGVCSMHIAAMAASANPMAYDYSAGWPATFGG